MADMTDDEFLAASVFASALTAASVALANRVHPKGDDADIRATSMMMLMSAQVQHACMYNENPDAVLDRAAEYLTEKANQLREDATAMADAAKMFATRNALVVAVADPDRCGHVILEGASVYRCARNAAHRGPHGKVRK